MGTILLYLVLGTNAVISLIYPSLGIALAYVVAVMGPQYIWWWLFQDVRSAFWVTLPTLCGFVVAVLQHRLSYAALNTRLNRCLGVLWLASVIAFYFGPYVDVHNQYRFYDPEFMFSTWQKTCLTYLVGVVLIDSPRKLKSIAIVMFVTVAYMTYWANAQYFIYQKFGRLHGPTDLGGSGIYSDENNFAVLFVVGFPFLFYLGVYLRQRVLPWLVWAVIPFSWHAVFLTASRGALLGISAVLMVFTIRLQKRAVGLIVIAAFVGAFIWQAGDIMKGRSATISSYEDEDSAASRIKAWEASIEMMAAHPITGVGFASFGQAFPDFSDIAPRIAHNTFFQIGGEWGILAGATYPVLMFSTLNRLRKNGHGLRTHQTTEHGRLYFCLNEACLLGLTGFFVCSLFLSLQQYEVLYFLLLLSNATLVLSSKSSGELKYADARSIPETLLLQETVVPGQRIVSEPQNTLNRSLCPEKANGL